MVEVTTEITINKPLNIVAAYASNPDNAPKWYKNIKSAEWKTPKPLTLGSEIAFVAHFLGRNLMYTYKIVELIPMQKLVMKTAQGPFPMETTYLWTKIDEHTTRMTLENRGKPAGFSKLLTPFMKMAMRRANNKDLRNIKKIIEGQ